MPTGREQITIDTVRPYVLAGARAAGMVHSIEPLPGEVLALAVELQALDGFDELAGSVRAAVAIAVMLRAELSGGHPWRRSGRSG